MSMFITLKRSASGSPSSNVTSPWYAIGPSVAVADGLPPSAAPSEDAPQSTQGARLANQILPALSAGQPDSESVPVRQLRGVAVGFDEPDGGEESPKQPKVAVRFFAEDARRTGWVVLGQQNGPEPS